MAKVIGPVSVMLAGCAVVWVAAVSALGMGIGRDVALGMLAPFVAVAATWVAVVWAHRRNPAGVTGVMMQGFVGKAIFFGVYVVAVWTWLRPEPTPFIVSFTGSFLALYLVEAILLVRLFRAGPQARKLE